MPATLRISARISNSTLRALGRPTGPLAWAGSAKAPWANSSCVAGGYIRPPQTFAGTTLGQGREAPTAGADAAGR
jgi:hypothetical protein